MMDPLSDVISLLQPRAVFSKIISGAGPWGVRYSAFDKPSFCTVLEGRCLLQVDGQAAITLEAGDFVLMPATPGFTLSGFEPVIPHTIDPKTLPAPADEIRHGRQSGEPDLRMLGGHFLFDSPDASLLVSLLPKLLHVRNLARLTLLVQLGREESTQQQPGREHILSRLVEVLLVEARAVAPPEYFHRGWSAGLQPVAPPPT